MHQLEIVTDRGQDIEYINSHILVKLCHNEKENEFCFTM